MIARLIARLKCNVSSEDDKCTLITDDGDRIVALNPCGLSGMAGATAVVWWGHRRFMWMLLQIECPEETPV